MKTAHIPDISTCQISRNRNCQELLLFLLFVLTIMNDAHNTGSSRIARNTLMLYIRMLVLLLVGLYTSRVVLSALGESDYGVYNVIGGVVAMFTIISGALNSAVSRFITFEMGKGESAQLDKVYSTAVTIQIILAAIVVIVAEPAGLWFIENEMTIDLSRIPAAKWVLQFSLAAFVINLMSVPQMASITAHEKMSAYAAIGLLDGFLRLGVAVMVSRSDCDRLVLYAALMAAVVLCVRMAYGFYCRRNFTECRYRPVFDRPLIREMFSFAGWNFIGVTSSVLRDHGGNILVNLFSGPAVNAARGLAVQLNGAIQGFVTNFMTAVNPQITKSYAGGEHEYMFSLMRKSSSMSFYLLFVLSLPVLFNTEFILALWLKDVPEHSVLFVRLFLIFALSEAFSNPLITAQLATGRIRNYQLLVGGLQLLNLPVSYMLLKNGAMPETTVVVATVISQICLFARLFMLRRMIGFPVRKYLLRVYFRALATAAASAMVFLPIYAVLPDSTAGILTGIVMCLLMTSAAIYLIGLNRDEKDMIAAFITKATGR